MHFTRKKVFRPALMALALLFTFFAPQAMAEEYTLENGLKVILVRQPDSGTVSGRLAFKVGSSDEATPAEYGMAHLLEHLLTKSVSRTHGAEIKYLVEDNGGKLNAFTSKDVTAYVIDVPKEAADMLPGFLIDQATNPLFLPEQVAEEQEIVVEEINRGDDNPNDAFFNRATGQFWGADHPFGRRIIGSADSVRGSTPESIAVFHARYYRPDNAVLILAGDFETEAMKRTVAAEATAWPRPDHVKPVRTTVPRPIHTAPDVQIIENPSVSLGRVMVTLPGFKSSDRQLIAVDLLTTVLSGGLASRLEQKVKRELELVSSIDSGTANYADYGYTVLAFETTPDHIIPAFEATLEVIEDFFVNPPDAIELERARSSNKRALLRSQDSTSGIADAVLSFETHGGGWRMRDLYTAALDATGVQDLLEVGHAVFGGQKMCITLLLPPTDAATKEKYVAQLTDLANRFALPAASERTDDTPVFVELEPIDGIRVLAMRDPSRKMVRVEAAVKGGTIAENAATNGLSSLTARSWSKATAKRNASVLARDVEQLGASIAGGSSVYDLRLSGEFIGDNWREALPLFIETLTAPAFNPGDVEEARREQLAEIAQREEDLASRAFELADASFYPGHPYGMNALGKRAEVESFTADQITGLYRDLVRNGTMILAIAGDIDPQEARSLLQAGLAGWRSAGAGASPTVPPVPPLPESLSYAREEVQSAQTHLIVTFPAPESLSPDRAAMQVVETHLGGMTGPLFRELREKMRLAYSTFPYYMPYINSGNMKWYISSEPGKVQTALDGMLDILGRLRENGMTGEEVEAAKRLFIGEYRISTQRLGNRVRQTVMDVLYDRGVDFRERYLEAIRAVTVEDVNRVVQKYLSLDHAVVSVLGSNTEVEVGRE